MFKSIFVILAVISLLCCSKDNNEWPKVKDENILFVVDLGRNGFSKSINIYDSNNNIAYTISCYSGSDEDRDRWIDMTNIDSIADLSCLLYNNDKVEKIIPCLKSQGLLALLWQKCNFWDSQGEIFLIHGEPVFVEAGDGWGLAGGSGAVACPIFGGAGEQDAAPDVPGLYRRSDWPG